MERTEKFVTDLQIGKYLPEVCSPERAEYAFAFLEGRWKLSILYQLFHSGTMRFSDLQRSIPKISERMLARQLRALERDGIVRRTIFPEVPPRVEYALTTAGQQLRPILHAVLLWADEVKTANSEVPDQPSPAGPRR